VFAYILLGPVTELYLFFIPIGIPAFIFAVLYLVISAFLDRKGGGNINHSAHFWGSVYGLVFVIAAVYLLTKYPLLESFAQQVKMWFTLKFG